MQSIGKSTQRRLNPRSHQKRSHMGIRKRGEQFIGDLDDDYHMAISLYDKERS